MNLFLFGSNYTCSIVMVRKGESIDGFVSDPCGQDESVLLDSDLRLLVESEVTRALFKVVPTMVTNLKVDMKMMIDERIAAYVRAKQMGISDVIGYDTIVY